VHVDDRKNLYNTSIIFKLRGTCQKSPGDPQKLRNAHAFISNYHLLPIFCFAPQYFDKSTPADVHVEGIIRSDDWMTWECMEQCIRCMY